MLRASLPVVLIALCLVACKGPSAGGPISDFPANPDDGKDAGSTSGNGSGDGDNAMDAGEHGPGGADAGSPPPVNDADAAAPGDAGLGLDGSAGDAGPDGGVVDAGPDGGTPDAGVPDGGSDAGSTHDAG